jgi:hypothetical protein
VSLLRTQSSVYSNDLRSCLMHLCSLSHSNASFSLGLDLISYPSWPQSVHSPLLMLPGRAIASVCHRLCHLHLCRHTTVMSALWWDCLTLPFSEHASPLSDVWLMHKFIAHSAEGWAGSGQGTLITLSSHGSRTWGQKGLASSLESFCKAINPSRRGCLHDLHF